MTYEELTKVNKSLKTVNIKGKDYVDVASRIQAFRMLYPEGRIFTVKLDSEPGTALFKAEIWANDLTGTLLATGHAFEEKNASSINRTSYIENCETSAVGRALGMLGIGSTSSIASVDEMYGAIEAQEVISRTDKLIDTIIDLAGGDRERVDTYVRNVFPGNRLEDLDYQTLVRLKADIAKKLANQQKPETAIPTFEITRRSK